MRPLPNRPVFDRQSMRALGWSDSATDRAVDSGLITRIRRGWYTTADQTTSVAEAIAAAGACADSAVAHRSALLLHGLPLVGRDPALPELTVAPRGTGAARAAHIYRATLRPEDVVTIDAVPVTSVSRTAVDVARAEPLRTSVPAIDAALRRGLTTRAELDDVARMCRDWPGIRRAHKALRLSDGRAESALESVSRLVIPPLGLPVPDLQVVVIDGLGCRMARLDFYWDEVGAAGEADGRNKYDGKTYSGRDGLEVFDLEKSRQDSAESLRVSFARWGWKHAFSQQQVMRARIRSALTRGAEFERAGIQRRWTIERTPRI